jgi:hypothetical protein
MRDNPELIWILEDLSTLQINRDHGIQEIMETGNINTIEVRLKKRIISLVFKLTTSSEFGRSNISSRKSFYG